MSVMTAGNVANLAKRYTVMCTHDHPSLKTGDVVVVVCTPQFDHFLLRVEDMTLHALADEFDQYVHLEECHGPQG